MTGLRNAIPDGDKVNTSDASSRAAPHLDACTISHE
jgi:hypothetical protein